MATRAERVAVKVALIGATSAVAVALIANADKLRGAPAPAAPAAVAPQAPDAAQADNGVDSPKPVTTATPPPIPVTNAVTVALTANLDKPPGQPAAAPPVASPLAPGEARLIAAWGRSNDGVDRQFYIKNDTSQWMTRLFLWPPRPARDDGVVSVSVAPPGNVSQGPDRLGGRPVAAGESVAIVADDGTGRCEWDMLAMFGDGRELYQGSFNVCSGMNFMWQFGGERRIAG